MFTKKPEAGHTAMDGTQIAPAPPKPPLPLAAGGTAPARQAPPAQTASLGTSVKQAASVIGADLTIIGNMLSKGEVQLEGTIQGDLHGVHVVIGEKARVTGGIVAEDVIIRGHVEGSVRGLRVTLQSSSRVEGDIYHQSLAIEQGAYFEGKSRRAEDPMAGIKTPELSSSPAGRPTAVTPASSTSNGSTSPSASS